MADHCGIGSNLGKTRVMAAKEGPPPPGIAELGDDVWRGDKPCTHPLGRCYARKAGHTLVHGCAWLSAVPSEPAFTFAPQAIQLALRRRLRLPLPLSPNRCGPSPGCGQQVDEYGDHGLACPRTGLLARRAKAVERAWVRVAREAVGSDGQVIPQQWLVHTTTPGVPADARRRLNLVVSGATSRGGAL